VVFFGLILMRPTHDDDAFAPGSLGVDFAAFAVPVNGEEKVEPYVFHHEPVMHKMRGRRCFELRVLFFLSISFLKVSFTTIALLSSLVGIGGWAAFYFTSTPSDLPLNLFTFAIIFPLSFLIQYSLTRRETTLREIANVKAAALLLLWGCRDFVPHPNAESLRLLRQSLSVFLLSVRQTMLHKEHSSGLYLALANIQTRMQGMLVDCPPNFRLSGIYARIHQVFQALVDGTERMLVIHHYRSPSSLRAYAMVFLFFNSLVFAPIFARYSLNPLYGTWSGIYCTLIVSFIYAGLYRILTAEEDPFSGHGIDVLSLEPLAKHANVFSIEN
jgi:hypothetical protein